MVESPKPPPTTVQIEKVPLPGMTWLGGLVAIFERPDGHPGRWEGISGGDGVLVLPITKSGKVVLVRQYRPLVGSWAVELPGVVYRPGEDPRTAVKRGLLQGDGLPARLR